MKINYSLFPPHANHRITSIALESKAIPLCFIAWCQDRRRKPTNSTRSICSSGKTTAIHGQTLKSIIPWITKQLRNTIWPYVLRWVKRDRILRASNLNGMRGWMREINRMLPSEWTTPHMLENFRITSPYLIILFTLMMGNKSASNVIESWRDEQRPTIVRLSFVSMRLKLVGI